MNITSTSFDKPKMVFVVDDDNDLRKLVCRWLELESYQTLSLSTCEECLFRLNTVLPVAILLDLNFSNLDGISTLQKIKNRHQLLPVIMMTSDADISNAVTAIQSGAYDYLSKPLDKTKLLTVLDTAIKKNEASLHLRELERENHGKGYEKIIGQSTPMRNLFKQLDSISNSDITVLIQGASGTGKELVAQAIHSTSSRKDEPFIALNCAAIPETLHESELFGYEKGTFTGAVGRKLGKFEQADRGTLFLDEVGEMSLSLQTKFLRVLQERNFQRLGGSTDIFVDFRLVTASHINLLDAVKAGTFREDLYYRLAVFELEIPILAERKEDIPLISQKIIEDFSAENNKSFKISSEVLELFQKYDFPGNVRELKNALHRAIVVCKDGIIEIDDLPKRIIDAVNAPIKPKEPPDAKKAETSDDSDKSLESLEKKAIEEAIERANGNLSEAIRQLGIGRATFYRKLKKFNIK
jgi:DNA-binding NtrC family response regulator